MPTIDIPVFINNFNRLTTTRRLTEDLLRLGYYNITILDNGSTYPPLLEWYTATGVRVNRLTNLGSLALYNSGVLFSVKNPWVVYTDSDIELNPATPKGFIETLIDKCITYAYDKAGLALRIDDLPKTELSKGIRHWESRFWLRALEKHLYAAEVDTTFCVVKRDRPFGYKSLRMAGNCTARHIPWYTRFEDLNEEEQYYLDHVDQQYSGYKRQYMQYLNNT